MWYINVEHGIQIDAPPSAVWEVFSDVERWPEWAASFEEVRGLDGAALDVGRRFAIKQPRLPRLVWEVTDLVPGASWTWRQRSVGATTLGFHELTPIGDGATALRQRIEHRGPLGVASGLLVLRQTRRYLALEAEGLKGRAEQRRADGAASG